MWANVPWTLQAETSGNICSILQTNVPTPLFDIPLPFGHAVNKTWPQSENICQIFRQKCSQQLSQTHHQMVKMDGRIEWTFGQELKQTIFWTQKDPQTSSLGSSKSTTNGSIAWGKQFIVQFYKNDFQNRKKHWTNTFDLKVKMLWFWVPKKGPFGSP